MGLYRCPRCDRRKDSQDGDTIPTLNGLNLVCEDCASDEEVSAYLGEGWR